MHIGGRHRYSFGETGARRAQFQRRSLLLTVAIVLFGTSASHSVVLRKPLEANVYALNRGGTDLRLEYKLPAGASAETFLRKYLSRPEEWRKYVGGTAPVAIPLRVGGTRGGAVPRKAQRPFRVCADGSRVRRPMPLR